MGEVDGTPFTAEGALLSQPGADVVEEHGSGGEPARSGSYVCSMEFVELLLCFGVFVSALVVETVAPLPNQRPIPYQLLDDGSYVINQAYNEEDVDATFPTLVLLVLGFFMPLILQLLDSCRKNGRLHIHKTVCVYLMGIGLTLLLTSLVKIYVGYLRPIFYDVCQPDETFQECTTSEEHELEVRRSFPSGHASFAFGGLSLLAFYLERQYGVSSLRVLMVSNDNNSNDPSSSSSSQRCFVGYRRPIKLTRFVSVLCQLPLALAGWIAVSRIVDNKHFPADVVGGSILGFGVASFVFSLWFPAFEESLV